MNVGSGIAAMPDVARGALLAMAGFAVISAAWWIWEALWDRRLFVSKAGARAVNLSAGEARQWVQNHPDLQILDLRTSVETARGTLPGARRVTWGEPEFRRKLERWDRSRPILVYCEGGYRSRKAVPVLRSLGFTSIHHLHRGMMAWRWAGHPVVAEEPGDLPPGDGPMR